MSTPDSLNTSRIRTARHVSERLLAEARDLGIDFDAAVDSGLEAAIRTAQIAKFESLAA